MGLFRSTRRHRRRFHAPWKQEELLVLTVFFALFVVMLLVARLVFAPTEAAASTQSELDSFLNEWETQLSTTTPGFYEGQRRGFVTGGATDLRFPSRTFSPFTISLPSIKGGCGGISLFGGAFSYINGDQFIQYLQNIAQNAVGVAFDMALRTLCPQCATVLSNMEAVARDITGGLKSSCQAVKALAKGESPVNLTALAHDSCTAANNVLGIASDTWASTFKCQDDAEIKAADTRAAAADALNPEKTPTRISQNIFWSAYDKLQGLNPFWDTDHGQYLMSLFGTLVLSYADDGATLLSKTPFAHTIEVDQLIGGWAANERKILRCQDSNCLNVQIQDEPAFVGFEQKIEEKLTELAGRLESRQRANPEPILQANVAGMPIVRLLTMLNHVPGGKEYVISTAKRTISLTIVHTLIKESLKLIRAEISRLNDVGLTQEYLEQLKERNREIDQRLAKYTNDMLAANSNLRVILEMAREAQGSGSPTLMGNLGFSIRNINPLTSR
jgi:conjugative transfer pilus assembly protein TraH